MKTLLAIILIFLLAIGVIYISRSWFRSLKSENVRLFLVMFMGFAIFLKAGIILSYFINIPQALIFLPFFTGSAGALIAFIAYRYQSR
jgi:Na+-driven multidrug efflux pump